MHSSARSVAITTELATSHRGDPAWVVVGVAVRSRRQRRQRVQAAAAAAAAAAETAVVAKAHVRLRAWGRLHRARLQGGVAAIGGVPPERDQGEEHHHGETA